MPFHLSLHVHWQLGRSPDTFAACPLQSLALVHTSRQSGYTPPYVGVAHAPQSPVALLYCTGHASQRVAVQLLRHVHWQLGTSPLTAVAWLLQSVRLQMRAQFG